MSADAGPDEAAIERLVRRFYGAVRDDALLGPIFAARVHDWEAHVATLCDFWSGVLLDTGRYGGRPLAAHVSLPIEAVHFERWLSLFGAAAREICPTHAAMLTARAERIAQSFAHGIATVRGTLPPRRGLASPGGAGLPHSQERQ